MAAAQVKIISPMDTGTGAGRKLAAEVASMVTVEADSATTLPVVTRVSTVPGGLVLVSDVVVPILLVVAPVVTLGKPTVAALAQAE